LWCAIPLRYGDVVTYPFIILLGLIVSSISAIWATTGLIRARQRIHPCLVVVSIAFCWSPLICVLVLLVLFFVTFPRNKM
jgi:hypothetical protein